MDTLFEVTGDKNFRNETKAALFVGKRGACANSIHTEFMASFCIGMGEGYEKEYGLQKVTDFTCTCSPPHIPRWLKHLFKGQVGESQTKAIQIFVSLT